MPRQRVIKCREQGDALLPQGRKVTADAAKHRYPNIATPSSVRKHPETFCCTLIMRRSLSA